MAYRMVMQVEVEARGATWVFEPADEAMGRLYAVMAESGQGVLDTNAIPSWAVGKLCDVFVASLVDWSGVIGPSGEAIPFNLENARRVPTLAKAEIAALYLAEVVRLEGSVERPNGPPTSSTQSDVSTAAEGGAG